MAPFPKGLWDDWRPHAGPPSMAGAAAVNLWVVMGEFAPSAGGVFRAEDIDAIMGYLDPWHPAGLWDPCRFAIQLRVAAQSPLEAVRRAVRCHEEAARATHLLPTTLVRIEVLAAEELDRSWGDDDATGAGDRAGDTAVGPPPGVLCHEVYAATRQLTAAATPAELTDTLMRFVVAAGGTVAPGLPSYLPGTVDIDMRIDEGDLNHATADAFSVGGLILESVLPALIHDARLALARLHQHQLPQHQP